MAVGMILLIKQNTVNLVKLYIGIKTGKSITEEKQTIIQTHKSYEM